MEIILDFIKSILWLVVVLTSVFVLRNPIKVVLMRLRKAKIPGAGEFDFDLSMSSVKTRETVKKTKEINARWENVANIYWLAHDLMWTMSCFRFGGSRRTILEGLKLSIHHLKAICIDDSRPESKLNRIKDHVLGLGESDLTEGIRCRGAIEIDKILDEIGIYMEEKQKDFIPSPNGSQLSAKERVYSSR